MFKWINNSQEYKSYEIYAAFKIYMIVYHYLITHKAHGFI